MASRKASQLAKTKIKKVTTSQQNKNDPQVKMLLEAQKKGQTLGDVMKKVMGDGQKKIEKPEKEEKSEDEWEDVESDEGKEIIRDIDKLIKS